MKRKVIFLILYLAMILFITMGIRIKSLMTDSISLDLFRAVRINNYNGIIYNVLLFIPLVFFLSDLFRKKWLAVLIAVLISLVTEILQYYTGRGQFDVDDLICNGLGVVIGVVIWSFAQRFTWKKYVPFALLCAGLIGCVIAPRSGNPNYLRQFDFHINSVSVVDREVDISGTCSVYNKKTPDYVLFLDDKLITTTIKSDRFQAKGDIGDGKHELLIQFCGYDKISTGTYLHIAEDEVSIEYVPGEVKIPFTVPNSYIFKAYNSNQPTYVFQDGERLLWYIGWNITPATEVIFHVQTNEPEKLPSHRVQYGFDNRGFRVSPDGMVKNEFEQVNGFRVFKREIPDSYNVTAVTVGYNTSGTITWMDNFRLE